MTDAPPLTGGDPSAILEWLVIQVAELREENSRMKMLLALHGVDFDHCGSVAAALDALAHRIEMKAAVCMNERGVVKLQIERLQAQVACL
jgi:hypothetical protein